MTNEIITLKQAINSIRGRPGLVFGPLATTHSNSFSLIVETAVNEVGEIDDINSENLSSQLDALRESNPDKARALEESITSGLEHVHGVNHVNLLMEAGWSMCISLTRDLVFESAVQNYQDSKPTSKSVTIVDHVSVNPQTRTIPIFKLLGNLRNKEPGHCLVLAESDMLLRRNIWRSILGTAADFLQGSPLVFFGTDNVKELVFELLSCLSTLPPPAPNSLLFLKNDPLLENPTIKSLCNSFSSVRVVDSTISEFSKAIKEMKPKQAQLNLSFSNEDAPVSLSKFNSIISLVPSKEISDEELQTHRQALVDSLFQPTVIDWDPYLCGLDIKRCCTDELLANISSAFSETIPNKSTSLIVRGDAGVGKTTFLKHVAVEMSKQGCISLWCRRAPMDNWIRAFKSLAIEIKELAGSDAETKQKFVFFVDDPWALRLDPAELIACFELCDVPIVFVFSLRNTEYFNPNGFSINLPVVSQFEMELPTQLSTDEIARLSSMLVRIGACSSQEQSDEIIKNIPTKNAEDVLCSLWYLIPETRSKLADSLRDEYHRLGAATSYITDFAHSAQVAGKAVQQAYECVCVTSKFHIGLPLEVLVRSLKISYEDFIDMTVDGKPLWGLIYDEEDNENQTVLYRTRNEIVTKVLLELVNGGVGHAGEFRMLKTLLSSCDVGSQIYREFAIEVLVRTSKELENNLSYEQGLELYNVAEKALPYEDRLLAHHKGNWIRRVGKDYQKAYSQLEKALETQQYPGAREAHVEHIQTSMAASVVGLVREGKQSPASGLQLVKDHIQQANNPRFFSAHIGHVSANLLFEMAQAQQQAILSDDGVGISSYSGALQEVEKTLQAIGPSWKKNSRFEQSIEMLRSLQQRIIESIPDDNGLEEYAYSRFDEVGSQLGFELILRKLFSQAQISDKGSSYNNVKNKIEEILKYIDKKNKTPSVDIIAIRTDLIVRWRLQKVRGKINWDEFKDDLLFIINDAKYRDSPIKSFYLAVALFQLGDIEQANAIFSKLRRMQAFGFTPKEIRCFIVGPEGHPKRYQCTINRSHGRSYAEIPELNHDIPVAGSNREIVTHTYVGFSLNGPLAWFNKPDENQMLLA